MAATEHSMARLMEHSIEHSIEHSVRYSTEPACVLRLLFEMLSNALFECCIECSIRSATECFVQRSPTRCKSGCNAVRRFYLRHPATCKCHVSLRMSPRKSTHMVTRIVSVHVHARALLMPISTCPLCKWLLKKEWQCLCYTSL